MSSSFIPYGTAGFRFKSNDPKLLIAAEKTVLYLVALSFGLLNNQILNENNRFGVMITASHNPIEDNGLKVMNSKGEMWPNENDLQDFVNNQEKNISIFQSRNENEFETPVLVIGWDTRPSCEIILSIMRKAIQNCRERGYNVDVQEMGVCTTPELHWTVMEWDTVTQSENWKLQYKQECAKRVNKFIDEIKKINSIDNFQWLNGEFKLRIDTAYGCGGPTLLAINEKLILSDPGSIINEYLGKDDDIKLNYQCGAEYVQKDQKFPCQPESNVLYASFDGDADRLVFSFLENNKFQLIDGDKIASLFAIFIKDRLIKTGLDKEITLGVVQTAYANGSSTKYLELNVFPNQKDSIACAATGVKHLHKKAHDFDIGVYFEANGHGTVLFSKRYQNLISAFPENEPLKLFSNLINQAVGDAITDMFAALCVLSYFDKSVKDWNDTYKDFYSLTTKLVIPDRSRIKTTSDERRIISPSEIQDEIDKYIISLNLDDIRTFVRPSGTEDVVRIYVEARDKTLVEEIESNVKKIVQQYFDNN